MVEIGKLALIQILGTEYKQKWQENKDETLSLNMTTHVTCKKYTTWLPDVVVDLQKTLLSIIILVYAPNEILLQRLP